MKKNYEDIKLFRPRDIVVYLFLIILFCFIVFSVSTINRGSKIMVQIEGKVVYQYSILENGEKNIEYNGKHLMDLIISEGDVYIRHSKCPLHLCERDRLSDSGVLVCVPQKVLVTFSDELVVDPESEVDLVTR
jgi:hypothetical protein